MAKNGEKTNAFGIPPESFRSGQTPAARQPEIQAVPALRVSGPEKKERRIQILTYGSLVDEIDTYARKMNTSRTEVFEAAVRAYLAQHSS